MGIKGFRRARKTVDVSVGESVRIIRELSTVPPNPIRSPFRNCENPK